jgi:hypothetical protein
VIGTLEEYPTEELAQAAINGLRTCINEDAIDNASNQFLSAI